MSFLQIFKNQGGVKLVLEYIRAGVLTYAVLQLFLTGFSKKSLEILRLGVEQRKFRKLNKKYGFVIRAFDKNDSISTKEHLKSNKVWFFWMQGLENAPALVRRCFASLQENLKDREIVLINEKNLNDYVQFPDFIIDKLNRGIITYTHFSDILRVELLLRYGGTWIDSTVFCSGKNIPKYMLDSDFFVFQNLRPGDNGSILNFSSWFMSSCSNNRILLATRELLYTYWKKNNSMIDYFLLHHFIMMAASYYKEDWKKVVQFPNSLPHVLLLMLFEPFNQEKWDAATAACPFHKLSYKFDCSDTSKKGTYYERILGDLYT